MPLLVLGGQWAYVLGGVDGTLVVTVPEQEPGEAGGPNALGWSPPDHQAVHGAGQGHVEETLLVAVGGPACRLLAQVVVRVPDRPGVAGCGVHVPPVVDPVDVGGGPRPSLGGERDEHDRKLQAFGAVDGGHLDGGGVRRDAAADLVAGHFGVPSVDDEAIEEAQDSGRSGCPPVAGGVEEFSEVVEVG